MDKEDIQQLNQLKDEPKQQLYKLKTFYLKDDNEFDGDYLIAQKYENKGVLTLAANYYRKVSPTNDVYSKARNALARLLKKQLEKTYAPIDIKKLAGEKEGKETEKTKTTNKRRNGFVSL